jgi:Rieske Fe-S protein
VNVSRRGVLAGAGGLTLLTACGGGSSTADTAALVSAGPLVALDTLTVGEGKVMSVAGQKVVVTRTGDATAVVLSAICTHQGCTVNGGPQTLHCPCHGSQFEATSGDVLRGPASSPLPTIPSKVVDGQVVVTG